MALDNDFSEENPFQYIKLRQIVLCFLLIIVGLAVQLVIIYMATGHDPKAIDRVFLIILSSLSIGLTIAWTFRRLKLIEINPNRIIGKLPNSYKWLPIIGIVIARLIFSLGIFRVMYYPVSFIFPSWLEKNLSSSFLDEAAKSFSPTLAVVLSIINGLLVSPIFDAFIFQGIVLHRWAAKWGVRRAVISLSLFYSILYSYNFLGGLSLGLMQNLLYIKSRTLIVPIICRIINNALGLIIFFLTLSVDNSLEQFRSEFKIGIVGVAISAPLLIWVLYKNRIRSDEQLPYFANANF
ncbi:MAG TPA: CPBP family intramembrane glutamic endopeptidase [Coleofasciculaceae cyanobacterium]